MGNNKNIEKCGGDNYYFSGDRRSRGPSLRARAAYPSLVALRTSPEKNSYPPYYHSHFLFYYFLTKYIYNIAITILYFVRSGYIYIMGGRPSGMNVSGYAWLSTLGYDGLDRLRAYSFNFGPTGVTPDNPPNHCWFGFPLGWLAILVSRQRRG